MTRIIVDKVAPSDITIAEWIRSLPYRALDQIATKSPSAEIRELARKEQRDRIHTHSAICCSAPSAPR